MGKSYTVSVYESEQREKVVARVKYNQDLDYWDGRNYSNGGMGRHKGLAKLRDGRWVIIYGSDWQGERDYGIVVTAEEALQEILKSGNEQLLETKKCKVLDELYNEMIVMEDEA